VLTSRIGSAVRDGRLRELYGVVLSMATVEALYRRRVACQRVQALAVPVACKDETGLRVADETFWMHVIGDDLVTAYHPGSPKHRLEGIRGHCRTRSLLLLLARRRTATASATPTGCAIWRKSSSWRRSPTAGPPV